MVRSTYHFLQVQQSGSIIENQVKCWCLDDLLYKTPLNV